MGKEDAIRILMEIRDSEYSKLKTDQSGSAGIHQIRIDAVDYALKAIMDRKDENSRQ